MKYEIVLEIKGENPDIFDVDELDLIKTIVIYAGTKTKFTIIPKGDYHETN